MMAKKQKEPRVPKMLRIPKSLFDKIVVAAEESGRNVQGYILNLLREIAGSAKDQAQDIAELRGWIKGAIVVFGMFAASNIVVTVLH